MTTDAGASAPLPFADLIDAAADAAPLTMESLPKAERMKLHRKALRGIFVEEGMRGVKAYKLKNEEAATIRINFDAIAYSPKPKGYDNYLVELAGKWLTDDAALDRTNKADVDGLNNRFGTSYPPAKHFSEPLSESRLKKIKEAFLLRGAYLDTARDNTMSKVRKAAKAHRMGSRAEAQTGRPWVIAGDSIVIGNRSFVLEKNGDRQCIRVSIDGMRRRFYLADIEWMANLVGNQGPDPLSDTSCISPITTTCSIGELAYAAEMPENQQSTGSGISGLAYSISEGSGLGKRIAAMKAMQQSHSATYDGDDDPLNL